MQSLPAYAADAESLVQEGLELRKQHKNDEALARFRAAFAVTPTARIRAQIALAEQALGDWVAAESDLAAALEGDDPWIQKNRATLEEALATIRVHLGWLLIETNVTGARLSVDGRKIGPLPAGAPIRARVGTVVVEVSAQGYMPVTRPVIVMANVTAKEKIELVPLVQPTANTATTTNAPSGPMAPKPDRTSSVQREVGFALGAAGVVALGFGAYFGILTLRNKTARDDQCDGSGCSPDGLTYDRNARSAATGATICFLGGGALLAV
ncbi:MAG: PEGA domain-containing protein, partial [Polyangiales bacterium]